MKLLLVCLLVVGSVFGLPQSSLLTRKSTLSGNANNLGVYGGKKAKIKDFPYKAAVLRGGLSYCDSVIVNETWVLTSGECGEYIPPNNGTVVVGSNDGVHGQKYEVEKIVLHPKYGEELFDYDFALLKTRNTIKWSKKVQPAIVTKDCPKAGTTFNVAGWGKTSPEEVSESNGRLMQGKLTLLDLEGCEDYYKGFSFNFTDHMACAWNQGKTTLCFGDWATGFVTSKNGKYYVSYAFLAVDSKGYCTKDAGPVILSNYCSVQGWIMNTIADDPNSQ